MKGPLLAVALALAVVVGPAPAHAQAGRTYYCGPNTNSATCGPQDFPGKANSCSASGCHATNPLNDAQGRVMKGAGSVAAIVGSPDAGMQAALTLYTPTELDAIAAWLLTLATQSTTPSCTVSSSNPTPTTGSSITLTAACTNTPTAYAWTSCTSTTSTCTATSAQAGSRTYSVTASNANGAGAPAGVTVTWIAPGTTPPPPPPPPPPSEGPPVPPPPTTTVVEYFHAQFGHYFITSFAAEIDALDEGRFAGWSRTGRTFAAYAASNGYVTPVCRFFTEAFAPRSSHFYTSNSEECSALRGGNRDWRYEAESFWVKPADPQIGSCPTGTQAVYRLYNDGQSGAPNHRYTTDPAVRVEMLGRGWIPEGYGPEGVGFCAPL